MFTRAMLILGLVSGCLDDDDDSRTLTATWHLTSISGDPVACPAGFGSAELVGLDKVFTTCAAGMGTLYFPPGFPTEAYVQITSDDHETSFARSPSSGDDGVASYDNTVFDAEILVDGGYFQFSWQFSWQFARADTTLGQCGDDGITDVAIEATLVDATVGTEQHFSCAAPQARLALVPGRYLVTISALDSHHQLVGAPHALGEQLILAPNKLSPVSDLGLITLAIP